MALYLVAETKVEAKEKRVIISQSTIRKLEQDFGEKHEDVVALINGGDKHDPETGEVIGHQAGIKALEKEAKKFEALEKFIENTTGWGDFVANISDYWKDQLVSAGYPAEDFGEFA